MCPFVCHDQLFIVLSFARKKCSHIYIAVIFYPIDLSREILLWTKLHFQILWSFFNVCPKEKQPVLVWFQNVEVLNYFSSSSCRRQNVTGVLSNVVKKDRLKGFQAWNVNKVIHILFIFPHMKVKFKSLDATKHLW